MAPSNGITQCEPVATRGHGRWAVRGVRRDPERLEVRVLMRRAPLHGARVLDVGCGDGRLTRRIAGIVRSATGVDPDAEQIERAKRLLPVRLRGKIRFEVGYAETLRFPNRSFDAVLFSWSL